MICNDCPRNCGVDRSISHGFCGQGENIKVAKIIENFEWEEDCIPKKNVAIFFTGCSLKCEYCQNFKISCSDKGTEYTVEEFVTLLKSFQGFDSLDLITPTHFSSKLIETFKIYKPNQTIIWNTSGYEKVENIVEISEFVDVFLTDFKYFDNKLSEKLSCAKDYQETAILALKKMTELKPNIFDGDIIKQGVIIRHLVLPNHTKDSFEVLKIIRENIENPFISIMSQFTPNGRGELDRTITPLEYKCVLNFAEKLGFNQGFYQDFDSASTFFIPKF